MFLFIKPSSDHYLLYEGTFNVCVHYGITYCLHQYKLKSNQFLKIVISIDRMYF